MSKKKAHKKYEVPIDYDPTFCHWPNDWQVIAKDKKICEDLLRIFTGFIREMIERDYSAKTIKFHMTHLKILGEEILRRINDEDGRYRKLSTDQILLKYLDEEGGPFLSFWDPNDPTELSYHKAFDSTCRKLLKYQLLPF